MKHIVCITILLFSFIGMSPLAAQDAHPEEQHQWLQKFVGQWDVGNRAPTSPDTPAETTSGTIEGKMLGKLWVVNEMIADGGGIKVHAMQTIGFDKKSNKFIGTWVDSMTDYIWQYEGSVDETGTTLILEAEGPNFMADGKMAKFRDSYEFKSPDHIVARAAVLGEDGKWTTFMTSDAKRKK